MRLQGDWFDGESKNIQSETVEETNVCSPGQKFALLGSRIGLGGHHTQKKATNNSFQKEMEVKIVNVKKVENL